MLKYQKKQQEYLIHIEEEKTKKVVTKKKLEAYFNALTLEDRTMLIELSLENMGGAYGGDVECLLRDGRTTAKELSIPVRLLPKKQRKEFDKIVGGENVPICYRPDHKDYFELRIKGFKDYFEDALNSLGLTCDMEDTKNRWIGISIIPTNESKD